MSFYAFLYLFIPYQNISTSLTVYETLVPFLAIFDYFLRFIFCKNKIFYYFVPYFSFFTIFNFCIPFCGFLNHFLFILKKEFLEITIDTNCQEIVQKWYTTLTTGKIRYKMVRYFIFKNSEKFHKQS